MQRQFHRSPSPGNQEQILPSDVESQLKNSLRLPSVNQRVADWLFVATDVHVRQRVTLPPHAFRTALALSSETQFIPSTQSLLRSHLSTSDGPSNTQTDTAMFCLYIPVEEVDEVCLGYTFTIGAPFDTSVFPLREVILTTFSLSGRFAFDKTNGQILVYVTGLARNTAMLMSTIWVDSTHRRKRYFALPKNNYSFHNLPNQVIGLTVNDEYVDRSLDHRFTSPNSVEASNRGMPTTSTGFMPTPQVPSDRSNFSDSSRASHVSLSAEGVWSGTNVASLHPHLLQGLDPLGSPSCLQNDAIIDPLLDNPTASNTGQHELSSPLRDNRKVVSGLGTSGQGNESIFMLDRSARRESGGTSIASKSNDIFFHSDSGLIDLSSLAISLQDIARFTQGSFSSPRVIRGVMEPSPTVSMIASGRLRTRIQPSDRKERELLVQSSLRSYYCDAQSVSADGRLLPRLRAANDSRTSSADDENCFFPLSS